MVGSLIEDCKFRRCMRQRYVFSISLRVTKDLMNEGNDLRSQGMIESIRNLDHYLVLGLVNIEM